MSERHSMTFASGALRRSLMLAALVAMFGVAFVVTTSPARAAGFTQNIDTPISLTVPNPCNGDVVFLSGTLHEQFHITLDNAGGANLDYHFNPQDVSGVGIPSGASYQGTGVTRQNLNFTPGTTFTATFVNNFRIIGQGPDNNAMVHENAHITVNPDGTITSSHDNFSMTCQ